MPRPFHHKHSSWSSLSLSFFAGLLVVSIIVFASACESARQKLCDENSDTWLSSYDCH